MEVTIERKGKPNIPLMLFKGKDGYKWSVSDSRRLPPMFTSDRPLNASVPPDVEEIIDQDYFYAGGGQITFEDLKRYFNSPGTDARVKGRVRLSPQIAKATITKAATVPFMCIRNWGFESGDKTGWSETAQAGNVWAVGSFYTPEEGTYNIGCYGNTGGNNTLYQDLENYANLKGKTITITARCYRRGGLGTLNIAISDGVGTTTSSNAAGSSAWETLTVTRAIDASATSVRFTINSTATNDTDGHAWDKIEATIAGTALDISPVVCFEDKGGTCYAAAGYYLLKWDATDWDTIACFTTPITALAEWTSNLIIALGFSTFYWYASDPSTSTTYLCSTLSTGKMKFFGVVQDTIWGSSSDYEVKSSTNPLNGGSWTTVTSVGNPSKTITALIDHPDTVLVQQQDALYEITTVELSLIDTLVKEVDANTGRALTIWKGKTYCPSGWGNLYELEMGTTVSNSVIGTITPYDSYPTQTDFDGFVTAMDGDANHLWVALDNGVKTELMAGRYENIDGTISFAWHQILEQVLTAASDNVRAMKFHTFSGVRSLWLGCAHATDGIYRIDMDVNMGLTGDLVTSWHTGKYKHVLKTFYSVTVRTENCDANKTITVYYKKEFDTSWTSLGVIVSNTSNTLYFTDYVTTKKLQIKFSLASNSSTTSPHILGYTLRCVSRPFDLEEGRITINEYGEFAVFGGLETNWQHPEFRDYDKIFYGIAFITEGLTDSKYITIQYKIDNESNYTTLDEVVSQSPYQYITLPECIGKFLKVKFTLSSPSDTTMIAYVVTGKLRPEKRRELEFTCHVASQLNRPNGAVHKCNVNEVMRSLREINKSNVPIHLRTFDAQEFDVTFENLTEILISDTIGKPYEYVVTIKAVEVGI